MAPALLAIPGCGPLTAAKILGETAGVDRFKSKDAFARRNGTAPMPVWCSNRARHRLSRTGNRQLNTALHRIALTQAHWHTRLPRR
jgi:transposase